MSRMPDNYNEAEAWARDRVGKRVYRHALSCKCGVCARVVDDGLVIADKYHASYITDYAMELGYRYADSREELEPMKNKRFFKGWVIFAAVIPLLSIPYWSRFIGEGKEYPNTMWLWLIGAEVFVLVVRAIQYFKK